MRIMLLAHALCSPIMLSQPHPLTMTKAEMIPTTQWVSVPQTSIRGFFVWMSQSGSLTKAPVPMKLRNVNTVMNPHRLSLNPGILGVALPLSWLQRGGRSASKYSETPLPLTVRTGTYFHFHPPHGNTTEKGKGEREKRGGASPPSSSPLININFTSLKVDCVRVHRKQSFPFETKTF